MATMQLKTNEQNFVNGLKKASGSVGELAGVMNVKLANAFKGADFYSRNFEKGIGRLSSAFKEAGQGMTLGLTLPLAFLGKSASDAYGEFDALRRALGTMETTSVGLSNRLKELREVAKMPGIGFQEAIQGDVRLRSVGISATLSAKILREFANAIAMTGGGKAQFNEITVQLGQMAAKGKVLAQDLRPIIEAAPAVATSLKNMFGTVSSEAISEMLEKTGKSSTDMITMLLTEMEKAPRVTGGWKNSLENLGDTLFVAKAEVFEVAANIFNLQSVMEGIATTVEGFVKGFKDLPEPLQKLILGLTALVAIVGPASYGIGLIISALATFSTGMGVATLAAGGWVLVVGAMIFSLAEYISVANKYERLTQSTTKTINDATIASDAQTKAMMKNVDIIKKGKETTWEYKKAKDDLIKLSPEFSSALTTEKINFEKLDKAANSAANSIIRTSQARALMLQTEETEKEIAKLRSGNLPSLLSVEGFLGKAPMPNNIFRSSKQIYYDLAVQLFESLKKTKEKLNQDYSDIYNVLTPPTDSGKPAPTLGDKEDDKDKSKIKNAGLKRLEAFKKMHTDEMQERNKQFFERLEQEKDIALALAEEMDMANLPKAPEVNRDRADDINWMMTFGFNTPLLKGLSEDEVKGWEDVNKAQEKGLSRYQQNLKDWPKNMESVREDLQGMSIDLMADMVSGFVSGEGMQGALKGALNAFGSYAIQLGKSILPLAKVLQMLKINPTPANAIALIAGGALVKGLAARIDVPKFAEGGAVSNPTLAMIGDNKSGKEMVLPFERTGEFANMIASKMGGGGGNFSVATKISGNDLLILVERAKKTK